MARYSELYLGDELIKLRDGLEVLERVVDTDALKEINLWLYGMVTDEYILDVAKEAIINSREDFMDDNGEPTVSESDIELTEIAIAVPIISSDSIDILYGRGYPLRELEFAYQHGEGEGVRTTNFFNSHSAYNSSSAIKVDKMGDQAFAVDEGDLSDFLQEKGKGAEMQVKRKVQRNEEATVDAPHVPEPPKPEAPKPESPTPVAPGMPKQTSLNGGIKLSDIVEKFLG